MPEERAPTNTTPQVRNNASIVEEKTIEAATVHDLGATEKGKVKVIKEVQKDHQQKEDQRAGEGPVPEWKGPMGTMAAGKQGRLEG